MPFITRQAFHMLRCGAMSLRITYVDIRPPRTHPIVRCRRQPARCPFACRQLSLCCMLGHCCHRCKDMLRFAIDALSPLLRAAVGAGAVKRHFISMRSLLLSDADIRGVNCQKGQRKQCRRQRHHTQRIRHCNTVTKHGMLICSFFVPPSSRPLFLVCSHAAVQLFL